MVTVVSERGQITLPKAVRVSLGLRPGTILDISVMNGQVVGTKRDISAPVSRWRGKGRLPEGYATTQILAKARKRRFLRRDGRGG